MSIFEKNKFYSNKTSKISTSEGSCYKYNIAVFGDKKVGKSSIIKQMVSGTFDSIYKETFAVNNYECKYILFKIINR